MIDFRSKMTPEEIQACIMVLYDDYSEPHATHNSVNYLQRAVWLLIVNQAQFGLVTELEVICDLAPYGIHLQAESKLRDDTPEQNWSLEIQPSKDYSYKNELVDYKDLIGIGTQVYSTMVQLGFLQVGSETDPGIETGFAGTLLGYNTFTDYWSNRKLFSDEMVFLTKDGKTYRWALELKP